LQAVLGIGEHGQIGRRLFAHGLFFGELVGVGELEAARQLERLGMVRPKALAVGGEKVALGGVCGDYGLFSLR
jgi:hypothetical protein